MELARSVENARVRDSYTECAAELSALLASSEAVPREEGKGWQPIASAPKDNWKLHQMRAVGAWKHKTYGWIWGPLEWIADKRHENGGYWLAKGGDPTLWMVLPPLSEDGR